MNFGPRKSIIGIVLLAILAAVLRLYGLGAKSLWSDEGIIWWIAQGSVTQDAPASYAWTLGWGRVLFGWNEFAARWPSAVYGFLTVIIMFLIGRAFFNQRIAGAAALAAAASAYLIPISQELRVYSLLGFLLLSVVGIFLKIAKEEKVHYAWWLTLLIVGLAGQYTHCFFIFVLGYLGIVLTWRRGWRIGGIFWIIIFIVLLISWPELTNTISLASSRPHARAADFGHLGANFIRLLRGYFAFFFGDYLTNLPGGLRTYLPEHFGRLIIAAAMLATSTALMRMGMIHLSRSGRDNRFQAFALRSLTGMAIVFTLLFLVVDVSSAAHLIFIYLPALLLLTVGWAHSSGWLKWIVASIFLVLTAISLGDYYRAPQWACERADWRAAGEFIQKEYHTGDAALFFRSRDAYYTLRFYVPDLQEGVYYVPRHDPMAEQNAALKSWWTATSPQEKIQSLLEKHPRVWVMESYPPGSRTVCLKDLGGQSWDFGADLRVRLIEKNARVN